MIHVYFYFSLHWYLAIVYNPAALLLLPTIKDSNLIESSHGISSSQDDSVSQSPSNSKSVEESCYIWILDSLGGKHKSMTIRAIKRYLYLEAQDKFPERMQHIDLHLFESRIKATYPNVPFQRNSTDCGLYVLQFTEMLVLKSPPLILNYLATKQDLRGWFSHEDISGRREKIKNILLTLTDEYRKVMGIDPLDQPSVIENPNLSDGSSSPIQMYDFNPDLLE